MRWKPSPMLRYTAMRAGLFAACFVVVWGLVHLGVLPAGLGDSNPLWVLLLALVVSAPLSYVLLRGVREDASRQVSERVERSRRAMGERARGEDAADEEARAGSGAAGGR